MSQYRLFEEAVKESNRLIKVAKWSVDQIEKQFGRRTLGEIIASGEVPEGACFEKELVVGYLAMQRGIPVTLATMSLIRPLYGVRLRAGIEIELDGAEYVFHPSTKEDGISLGRMPYKKMHAIFSHKITRAQMLPYLNYSWFNNFGILSITDLNKVFPEIDPVKLIESLKKLNQR